MTIASKMTIFFTLLTAGSLTTVFGQAWIETSGTAPPYIFSGDTVGKDGETLYVCRAAVGEMCSGKTWFLNGGQLASCRVPYGELEFSRSPFEVLTAPPWEEYKLEWSDSTYSWGSVPDDAVTVEADSGIYVGRLKLIGGYVLGKINYAEWAFFYTENGEERFTNVGYEVLEMKQRSIGSYEVRSVIYDFSRASQTVSTEDVVLGSETVSNDTPYDTTSSLSLEITESTKSKWSETDSLEMYTGKSLSITAGIPKLNSTGGWEVGKSSTMTYPYGESFTTEISTRHEISVELPANSNVQVSITANNAHVNVPYTAAVAIFYESGDPYFEPDVRGIYSDVHHTLLKTIVDTSPFTTHTPSPATIKKTTSGHSTKAASSSPGPDFTTSEATSTFLAWLTVLHRLFIFRVGMLTLV